MIEAAPRLVARDRPDLILGDHGLCPGCGEPLALQIGRASCRERVCMLV